jgi:hypothetical protein
MLLPDQLLRPKSHPCGKAKSITKTEDTGEFPYSSVVSGIFALLLGPSSGWVVIARTARRRGGPSRQSLYARD